MEYDEVYCQVHRDEREHVEQGEAEKGGHLGQEDTKSLGEDDEEGEDRRLLLCNQGNCTEVFL